MAKKYMREVVIKDKKAKCPYCRKIISFEINQYSGKAVPIIPCRHFVRLSDILPDYPNYVCSIGLVETISGRTAFFREVKKKVRRMPKE